MKKIFGRDNRHERASSNNSLAGAPAVFSFAEKEREWLSDVFFLLAVFGVSALYVAFVIFANSASASDITAAKIIDLANSDRRANGFEELSENAKLIRAAEMKAEDMVGKNYFSHNAPDGTTPWRWIDASGYEYDHAGENLAMDFKTSEKMNQAWLDSPTHRANILNDKYKDIGVAVKEGTINGHTTIVTVQMFGSGDDSAPEQLPAAVQVGKEQSAPVNKGKESRPQFPAAKQKIEAEKFQPAYAVITSPAGGEKLSDGNIGIVGRAKKKSTVEIFDGNVSLGLASADERGWFKLDVKNLLPGEHRLKAAMQVSGSAKSDSNLISGETVFRIDAEKPVVRYQLFAAQESGGQYILKVTSNEDDCIFQWNGETIASGRNKSAVFFKVPTGSLSGMVGIRDSAGNKSHLEIALTGLHREGTSSGMLTAVSNRMSAKNYWSSGLEKEALIRNLDLRLAMGGYK